MKLFIAKAGVCGLAILLITGCFSVKSQLKKDGDLQQIHDIVVTDHEDRTVVTITAEKPVVYTAFRLTDPERLIVDMARTTLGPFTGQMDVASGALVSMLPIEGEAPSYVGRLELILLDDAESRIRAEGNILIIDIEKPVDLMDEDVFIETADLMESETEDFESRAELGVPFGIEVPEEEFEAGSFEEEPEDMGASDFVEDAGFPESDSEGVDTEFTPMPLEFEEPSETEEFPEQRAIGEPVEEEAGTLMAVGSIVSTITVEPENGGLNIFVSGEGEFKQDVFMVGENRLVIDILGATTTITPNVIPVGHSPVQRVRIGQHMDPKKVRVVLDLDQPVLYDVETQKSELVLFLQPAATQRFEQEIPVSVEGVEQPVADPEAGPSVIEKPPREEALAEPVTPQHFGGRKISLDFQDADLVNVLRLMADVSDLNVILGSGVKGRVTVKLKNVPWDQALEIILKMNNLGQSGIGNILQIDTLANMARQLSQEAAAKAAKVTAEDLVTRIISVNYAVADKLVLSLKKNLSPRGSIMFDKRTNKLIVKDIQETIDEIVAMVEVLDSKTPQVLIEAKIVQADRSFSQSLGVMWGAAFTNVSNNNAIAIGTGPTGSFNTPVPGFGINFPAAVQGINAVPGLGFSFGRFTDNPLNLDLRLSAGELIGITKTISSPRIIAMDNTRAIIEQGESIPFSTTSDKGTQTEFIDANLILEVTPHVTSDGSIIMKVKAAKNALGSFSGPAGPSIVRREAMTKILLRDGETAVIGGIFVDESVKTSAGLPWLSKIPVLGWLFKNMSKSEVKNELLIFLTPTILKD